MMYSVYIHTSLDPLLGLHCQSVSWLSQPVSQSVWLGLAFSLSLSLSLSVYLSGAGGCLSPAPWPGVHWECLSHGCVRSVHLLASSLLLPLSVHCILLACLAVVSWHTYCDAAGITWLLVCTLYMYVYREECRWVRGHLCLIFIRMQG